MSKKILGIIILGLVIVANLYANGSRENSVKKVSVMEKVGKIFDYQYNLQNRGESSNLTQASHDNVEFILNRMK